MEDLIRNLLSRLGEDPDRPGLERTPERVAQSLREMTSGYGLDGAALLGEAVFPADSDGLVICRDIRFVSLCEHHLLPFFGTATVAFQPAGKLVGISKLVRVTEAYAHRLQVQERLGQQILGAVEAALSPAGALVHIDALHMCMVARGVRQAEARMETLNTSGVFKKDPALAALVLRGGR
jgi:GTP cyclohydrolase I